MSSSLHGAKAGGRTKSKHKKKFTWKAEDVVISIHEVRCQIQLQQRGPNLFRIFQLPAKRQIYVDTWKQFPEIWRINMSTHDK